MKQRTGYLVIDEIETIAPSYAQEHTPNEGEPHPASECEQRGCVKLRNHAPAAEREEWRVGGRFISDCAETLAGMTAIHDAAGNFIGAVESRERATAIITAVNTHAANVELIKQLAAALEDALLVVCQRASGQAVTTSTNDAFAIWNSGQQALTAIRKAGIE